MLLPLGEEALRVRARAGVVGRADLGEDDVMEHHLRVRDDVSARVYEVGLDPRDVPVHRRRVDERRARDRVVRRDCDRPGLEDERLHGGLGGRSEGQSDGGRGGE